MTVLRLIALASAFLALAAARDGDRPEAREPPDAAPTSPAAEDPAARIVVQIESEDAHDVWGTVGASENIIEASWIALNDAVEYKLYKDAAAG